MTSPPRDATRRIAIHYLRPPDRRTVYHQLLVHDDGRAKVTFAPSLDFAPPIQIGGTTVLESGSDAVWFTFPGAWHDVGRFYRADGTLSGVYANVITPCLFHPGGIWHTTDLFVDLWIPAATGTGPEPGLERSRAQLVDLDELESAVEQHHLAPALAARARDEGNRLLAAVRDGTWPPGIVEEWTRARARRRVERSAGAG